MGEWDYKNFYEKMGAGRAGKVSAKEEARIRHTIGMLPGDVRSVLEVGCGDGRILDRIIVPGLKIGIEYAFNSLRLLRSPGCRATAHEIPFKNRSFDAVICAEVLEHLSSDVLISAVSEVKRVAAKYVLLSVPYRENLRLNFTRCSRCGLVFHRWGHLRLFTSKSLDKLFGQWECLGTSYMGEGERWQAPLVTWVNQRLGGRWADFEPGTACPACGNTEYRRTPRNWVTRVCGALNLLSAKLPVRDRNWIFKLYGRP